MGSTRVSSNLTAVVQNNFERDVTVHPVGFEPTPPKRTELESVALDHSATDALMLLRTANSEIRTRDLPFTKRMH